MATYAIRGGAEGARRLDLLAQVMGPMTEALVRSSGVAAGMSCLDIGCGAGHVSRCLASHVGPTGRVVGLDFDAVKLAAAREESQRADLRNIEFRLTDVTAWAEPATYDVVYGRFIVSHLAKRPAFVGRLYEALRSPGILLLEDIDFTGAFCYPPSSAFARYCELYTQVISRRGGDANVGLQLYQLGLDAGLQDVHIQVVQPIHGESGPEKGLTLSTLVNIADAAVAEGLATEEELRQTIAGLTALTEDSRSIVACPRISQLRGHRRTFVD